MSVSLRRTTSSDQDKKSRFEEVDQDTFHQDLQSPDLCPRNDCCSRVRDVFINFCDYFRFSLVNVRTNL